VSRRSRDVCGSACINDFLIGYNAARGQADSMDARRDDQPISSVVLRMQSHARSVPKKTALLGVDGASWSYSRLWACIGRVVLLLQEASVSKIDRVAIVLPNGVSAAIGFLGVSSCATAAPLNPGLKRAECKSILRDLEPALLLTMSQVGGPARHAAAELGLKVVELPDIVERADPQDLEMCKNLAEDDLCGPEDIGLVLHTSGTTSKPKRVPLTQAQLAASAGNIASVLGLSGDDRCLNVMPLFHIHGLVAGLLASLSVGGSVVCTPGFKGESCLDWLTDLRPTWYTAVPTIHQSFLAEMDARGMGRNDRHTLRLIRSSSSAMAPHVLARLEERMGVPVVEAYGMTEATHQIASNPRPPALRKPGSVGTAIGVEAVVLDEEGNRQPAGIRGELALRGPTICAGYEDNDEANAAAFHNGWFRTGDEGMIDEDGYIFLVGRSKEMINRGGEKITPVEIDRALLEHPAVGQAVAFAVPHPSLGEDVAAAVVLKPTKRADENELRGHLLERISEHKVPSCIVFVEEIPKGASGKLQRIGMANQLKDRLVPSYRRPKTPFEVELAGIWGSVLGVERIGRDDNFFLLGGDSLKAMRTLSRIRNVFNAEISVQEAFRYPVLREQAEMILRVFTHRGDTDS